jgi:hypothetical protein
MLLFFFPRKEPCLPLLGREQSRAGHRIWFEFSFTWVQRMLPTSQLFCGIFC